jgi:hypothetical protein
MRMRTWGWGLQGIRMTGMTGMAFGHRVICSKATHESMNNK